ncbi:hypothetical protein [Actinomadura oligospora]|uniref:hypothetical protein n=1 Tax=Actinomadura oligospora TaxID=111804 RepID=UPI000479E0C6|nr:hypothetical protein [Actinomadura oligospora]
MRAAPRAASDAPSDTPPEERPDPASEADPGSHSEAGDPASSRSSAPADADRMALSLVTLWAMRTGRTPPPAPYTALTGAELLTFWADPRMDPEEEHPAPPT